MKFHEYLDSVEHTDGGASLREKIETARDPFAKLFNIPFVGKMFRALIAFADSESIPAFRETEHFTAIKDWNIKVTRFGFNVHPPGNPKVMLAAKLLMGVTAAMLVVRFIKRRRRRKYGL